MQGLATLLDKQCCLASMGGTEFSFCFSSQSSQLTIANPVLGYPLQIAHSFEKKKQQNKQEQKESVYLLV